MSDYGTSLVRTLVPMLVGTVVTWLATLGVSVTDSQKAALIGLGTSLISGAYYVVVRWLETKAPSLGWLLGTPKPPSYSPPPVDPQPGA